MVSWVYGLTLQFLNDGSRTLKCDISCVLCADALDAPKQVQRRSQLLRVGSGEWDGVYRWRARRLEDAAMFQRHALYVRRADRPRLRLPVRRRQRPRKTDTVASRRPTSGRHVRLRALCCNTSGDVRTSDNSSSDCSRDTSGIISC